jgi:tripartite-type tricarboxylate transporter receptor subunit TctC
MKKEGDMKRSSIVIISIFFLLGALLIKESNVQAAEKYPVKPITCVIPMEAGADGDINGRPLMERVSTILGKPIIVVNKPGAGQTIGYREIYQAKPDGYTIGSGALTLITAKLQGFFPYDHRDFTLMGVYYFQSALIFASNKTQRRFKTVQEAFAAAKARPGEISLATTAAGGAWWISTMLLQDRTGLEFNVIPQEGSGGFVIGQIAGGHTELAITGASPAKPHIESGSIRALAVIGPERYSGILSDVPTLKELGYDVSLRSIAGIIGPPKMPKDIVDKLAKAFEIAVTEKEYQQFLSSRFVTPVFIPPDKFFSLCEETRNVYRGVFAKAGLLKEK